MDIAIIGAGISGLVAARKLHREHRIAVYEANDYIGGHTNTVDVNYGGRPFAVDTGFIVFNSWTYPNFVRLLDELGVASQPSSMSFSVRCERDGLEYNGTSLNTLFAQRRNLLRPSFHRMLRDILRFNSEAKVLIESGDESLSLGEFLRDSRYSPQFVQHYIIPMGAAIWSTDPRRMYQFPARYFMRFLNNHGMLSVNDRPIWRVVQGGSSRYVEPLIAPFKDRVLRGRAARAVRRLPDRVEITDCTGAVRRFDAVFLACHSDQALKLLADPSPAERAVLGAIPYQPNEAVLHTDARLLPRNRRAWAAWNYHVPADTGGPVVLTYNMNILQGLDSPCEFLVTLNNAAAIDPASVIATFRYDHPLYTRAGVAAQRRHREINGASRTYFCGAYWGFGFHEDGVNSALTACSHFEDDHAQLPLRRVG